MYTKQDIINDIKNLGIKPTDTLLVHSSMKAIGPVENRAEGVLDAFIEYMEKGLLIFPTHTWYQMNKGCNLYDAQNTESCVGILSNLFRKRPGVYRSLHPTHSVAAKGKRAEAYVQSDERFDTPCPRKGCFGRLYDENAKILLIGCGFDRNTYIHGMEEWLDVPGRLTDHQEIEVISHENYIINRPMRRHINMARNYVILEPACIEKGITSLGKIGDADCMVSAAKSLADLTMDYLKKDINLFSNKDPIPDGWYKN